MRLRITDPRQWQSSPGRAPPTPLLSPLQVRTFVYRSASVGGQSQLIVSSLRLRAGLRQSTLDLEISLGVAICRGRAGCRELLPWGSFAGAPCSPVRAGQALVCVLVCARERRAESGRRAHGGYTYLSVARYPRRCRGIVYKGPDGGGGGAVGASALSLRRHHVVSSRRSQRSMLRSSGLHSCQAGTQRMAASHRPGSFSGLREPGPM